MNVKRERLLLLVKFLMKKKVKMNFFFSILIVTNYFIFGKIFHNFFDVYFPI